MQRGKSSDGAAAILDFEKLSQLVTFWPIIATFGELVTLILKSKMLKWLKFQMVAVWISKNCRYFFNILLCPWDWGIVSVLISPAVPQT